MFSHGTGELRFRLVHSAANRYLCIINPRSGRRSPDPGPARPKTDSMKMKHIFILLLAAISITACNRTANAGGETLTVDELLTDADALVGDTVRVEGLCVSTCGHGSTHITLMGSDTTQVIEALADERMQSFDPLISNRTVAVEGVVAEQRVELPFLDDWEMRLDASIEGGKGNPEAVAVLKGQIRELRDSIAARRAREGKEYWSIYRIETFACHAIDDEAGR